MLSDLVKFIAERYKTDPTVPSVIVAWLGTTFYVSVVRYSERFAKGEKTVVAKVSDPDLDLCLKSLFESFQVENVTV